MAGDTCRIYLNLYYYSVKSQFKVKSNHTELLKLGHLGVMAAITEVQLCRILNDPFGRRIGAADSKMSASAPHKLVERMLIILKSLVDTNASVVRDCHKNKSSFRGAHTSTTPQQVLLCSTGDLVSTFNHYTLLRGGFGLTLPYSNTVAR